MNPENRNNQNNLNNNLINLNKELNNNNNNILSDYDSDTELNTSSSTDTSHKIFSWKNFRKRIYSSQIDFNRTKQPKYKGLINEDEINTKDKEKEKLIVQVESVNIFKIYAHLNTPIDWFIFILAIIGSIGAGISVPIMSFTTSEVYSNIANTSENRDSKDNLEEMILAVKETMNKQIRKQIINGIVSFICYFSSISFWSLIGNRCIFNLKKKYFTTILSQEQGWFDSNNPFTISASVYAELEKIEQGIGDKFGVLITQISQCIIGFIFAFISSWKLSLVMSCFTPFAIFIPNFLFISMRKGIILSRKTWGRAGGMIEEMLYNIKTVASFANFDFEKNKFRKKIEEVWKIDLNNAYKFGLAVGCINFFVNLCIFIGLIYGRTIIISGDNYNNGGKIISAVFCELIAISVIGAIAPNFKTIQDASIAFAEYYNLYKRKSKMNYQYSIEKPPISEFEGKIEFKNVSFYYPSDPKKKIILDNMNLLFEAGKKIAIVGESGCGKSTIANLIERFYDINEGELLIDDIEIHRYDIEYLRSLIGFVQQEPVIFNKSIKENIIFGREDYLKSIGNIDELVWDVCQEVYINEFIDTLPGKLNYYVGVKGNKLSGGQKQRIAIARAILTRPKILILDEATSSLDNKAEKEVQKALDNISQKNITTIIIAHRLSTIINSDLIYVIKNGKVIEKGNHKDLLDLEGYYAELFKNQINSIKSKPFKEKFEREKNNKKEDFFENNDDQDIVSKGKDIPIKPSKILTELYKYKLDFFLAIFSVLLLGCLTPFTGYIVASGINSLNSKYQIKRYNDGLKFGIIFLLFAFLQGLGHFLMIWKFQTLGVTLAKTFREKILSKYLQFHLSYFDLKANSPGSLVTKLSIDTMNLNQMIMTILGTTIQCGCIAIIGFILGCTYDYRLTIIDFCFVPFIVLANVLRKSMVHGQNKRYLQANIKAGGILSEFVINTKTIFSFNFQKRAIKMYLEAIEYVKQYFLRDAIISGFFIGLGNFCSFAAYATIFRAAKKYIIDGSLDSENMAIIITIVTQCSQGLSNGMGNLGELRKAKFAYKSIYSILETPSLISPFSQDNIGKISAKNIKGKIEFKHVYFSYPTRHENTILKDLSLIIMPGQHIGIVGHSGSGKSTIVQLLCRFYDIEEGKGEILIDDINIKKYNLFELRKKIGLVLQEPSLFQISVLENVRYGKLDATDEECVEAAKKADIMKLFTKERRNEIVITPHGSRRHGPHGPHGPHGSHGHHGHHSLSPHSFKVPHGPHGGQNPHNPQGNQKSPENLDSNNNNISLSNIIKAPHGPQNMNDSFGSYMPLQSEKKTEIGDKKDPVSAGEKQRLAIARAFLKDPSILLLDEATSSLDKNSELEVQKSLENLAKNRTCISIAHRLSTIENCDQIFVLEKGSLVEQGTHNELMKLGKRYFTFHKYTNLEYNIST